MPKSKWQPKTLWIPTQNNDCQIYGFFISKNQSFQMRCHFVGLSKKKTWSVVYRQGLCKVIGSLYQNNAILYKDF